MPTINDLSNYRKARLQVPEAEALRAVDELIARTPKPYHFDNMHQRNLFYRELQRWNVEVEEALREIFDSNAYATEYAYANAGMNQQTESWMEEILNAENDSETYVRSLLRIRREILLPDPPPTFYSCFLSYARADAEFANLLRSSLAENQVGVWQDIENMEGGKFWRPQIHAGVRSYDKLILICSSVSVQRLNVVEEIVSAMERERETQTQKLFPIRLDDFILSEEMLQIADGKLDKGEWREDWVRYVRAYHIPDFSRWKQVPSSYEIAFQKLLQTLRMPAHRA